MKKIILALMLFAGSVSADFLGQAGIGLSKGNNGENHVTAFAGVEMMMGAGLRLEYTKNFSEHPEFSKEDVSRYGLFAVYQFSLIPYIAITPKIGLVKTDGDFKVLETAEVLSKSSTKFTYGLEIDYYFTDMISIFLGYTDYGKDFDVKDMDTANFTLGLKLHI